MDGPDDIEVLGARSDTMDRYWLSLELLKSMREIDTRIAELKIVLGEGPCPGQPERRQKIVDRVQALIDTRFKLMYSFMDLNPQYRGREREFESCNAFDNIRISYDDLKRQLTTGR